VRFTGGDTTTRETIGVVATESKETIGITAETGLGTIIGKGGETVLLEDAMSEGGLDLSRVRNLMVEPETTTGLGQSLESLNQGTLEMRSQVCLRCSINSSNRFSSLRRERTSMLRSSKR